MGPFAGAKEEGAPEGARLRVPPNLIARSTTKWLALAEVVIASLSAFSSAAYSVFIVVTQSVAGTGESFPSSLMIVSIRV